MVQRGLQFYLLPTAPLNEWGEGGSDHLAGQQQAVLSDAVPK